MSTPKLVRKIILVLAVTIGLVFAYNLFNQIMTAVRSGDRLSQAADRVFKLGIKNKALKEKLAEIRSAEFIEKEARNKLGFAKKGETVVVIPPEKLKSVLGASQSAQVRLPNWLGWLKVFWK